MQCPYSTLGLTRGASTDDIKKAYKKLVLQHHPDRHASAGEAEVTRALAKFKAIKEAYEVLSDDRKRSAYEAGRSTGTYGSSSSGGYSSYSYRAGYGAGYGSSHYNTDWAKSYYQHQQTRNARLSPWQLFRRRVYAAVMANNASLHLGLAGILLGGLFVGDVVHRTIWDLKNSGKHFKDVQQQQQQQVGLGAARSMGTWRSPGPVAGSSSSGSSSSTRTSSSSGRDPDSSSSGDGGAVGSPGLNSSSGSEGIGTSERSSSSAGDAGVPGTAAGSEEGQPRQLRPGPYANMRGMPVQPDATGDM